MTKVQFVEAANAAVANHRNPEAYLLDGNVRYRDRAKGYAQRITFREFIGHLHGVDMRALIAARA